MPKSLLESPELFQFTTIYAVRRADGARLAAKRITVDQNTPLRWTIVIKDRLEMYIFDEMPMYDDTERKVPKQYHASELSTLAQEAGFEDWQQAPQALVEMWDVVGDEYRKISAPRYQLPDQTPYPID